MAFGLACTIKVAYLGVAAWDVLGLGFMNQFGLTVGTWGVLIGATLVTIVYFTDKQYVSWGTFGNLLGVGPLIDFFMHVIPYTSGVSLVHDWSLLLIGAALTGIGGGMYGAAKFGTGPRDSLLLLVTDRTHWDMVYVRMGLEGIVFLIGMSLGAPIFFGTLLFTFVLSYIYKFSFFSTKSILYKKVEKIY